jgi:hypothetical protein
MPPTPSNDLLPCFSRAGIDGCYIETEPPSSHALPVNLRVFFNPDQNLALFRIRAGISASPKPLFLDISPDKIQSLSLMPGPPTYLCFCATRITRIVPQEPLLQPVTEADYTTLETLRRIAQQSTVRVLLPDSGYETSQFVALCKAVGQGDLHPDPTQANLQSLYWGKGGRIIEGDEELWPTPSLSTVVSPGGRLPPPSLSSTPGGDELPPYSNLGSNPPPPSPPQPPVANKKRKRGHTPPLPPTPLALDYHTWAHPGLASGEHEKMLCELLRRMAEKEKSMRDLMNAMAAKEAVVDEKIASLTLLLTEVQEKEAALREAGGMQSEEQQTGRVQGPGASEASTASPTPPGSLASTVSVSSNISSRIQTHINNQIDELRDEIAGEYPTRNEVDLWLSAYVEEYELDDAVRTALDTAMERLRSRLIEALEE